MTRKSANTVKRVGDRSKPGARMNIEGRGAVEVKLNRKRITMLVCCKIMFIRVDQHNHKFKSRKRQCKAIHTILDLLCLKDTN